MLCALIMAGGKGERFWPLSTDEKPKQFLNLLGNETMLQMTVTRLKKLIPIERIFIATNIKYYSLVREQVPEIPHNNLIMEPVGRNTAPCIALSAFTIEKYNGDSTLLVLPSDHLIKDNNRFIETIKAGAEIIHNNKDAVVTLGVTPVRPETAFGYIKVNKICNRIADFNIYSADSFVEKPDSVKAEEYYNSGNYLWNSGMFIWRTSTIKSLFKSYLPATYNIMEEIAVSIDTDKFENVLQTKYYETESISVDYAILEKLNNIFVIPSDFGWDDVGNWESIRRYGPKDSNNNIYSENTKLVNCSNTVVIGNQKKVIAIGLSDIFVIDSDDYLIITKDDYLDQIRNLKKDIK